MLLCGGGNERRQRVAAAAAKIARGKRELRMCARASSRQRRPPRRRHQRAKSGGRVRAINGRARARRRARSLIALDRRRTLSGERRGEARARARAGGAVGGAVGAGDGYLRLIKVGLMAAAAAASEFFDLFTHAASECCQRDRRTVEPLAVRENVGHHKNGRDGGDRRLGGGDCRVDLRRALALQRDQHDVRRDDARSRRVQALRQRRLEHDDDSTSPVRRDAASRQAPKLRLGFGGSQRRRRLRLQRSVPMRGACLELPGWSAGEFCSLR